MLGKERVSVQLDFMRKMKESRENLLEHLCGGSVVDSLVAAILGLMTFWELSPNRQKLNGGLAFGGKMLFCEQGSGRMMTQLVTR